MSLALLSLLAEASLRSLALAAVVGTSLRAVRARPGGTRHAAWTVVLLAMLAMPVLPRWLPAWPVTVWLPEWPPLPGATAAPPLDDGIASSDPLPGAGPGGAKGTEPAGEPLPPARLASPASPGPAVARPRAGAAPPRAEAHTTARASGVASAAVVAYAVVGGLLLLRMLVGWLAVRRLVRDSEPVRDGDAAAGDLRLLESASVSGPVTVGVWRSRVLLPEGWRQWPPDWRTAVIAHEREHLRRRDPLIRALATLNTCLFWFHPLSWWLAARLRESAEHACDVAGARVTRDPERYAEILLELARRARPGAGAWAVTGMASGARLEWRIDRLLEEAALAPAGRRVGARAAFATALLAAAVAACRPPEPPPAPLVPDPRIAEEQSRRELVEALMDSARDLEPGEVAALEARLAAVPEDLEARQRLLSYYFQSLGRHPRGRSDRAAEREALVTARRAHVLWVVEHLPASPLAASTLSLVVPAGYAGLAARTTGWHQADYDDPRVDPVGHARALEIWRRHVADPGAPATLLGNAALFFESADAERAERLLLRARRLEPGPVWSRRLGGLYARAELGSVARVAPARVASLELAGRLSRTRDAEVLIGATLEHLRRPHFGRGPVADDPRIYARVLVERAVLHDPSSVDARALRQQLERGERIHRSWTFDREFALVDQPGALRGLPEADRFALLPELTVTALGKARRTAADGDPHLAGYTGLAAEHAEAWARELLAMAPGQRSHPRHGAALFHASMTLAELALEDGDRSAAARHLGRAASAPACEELAYGPFDLRLPGRLLDAGERESVVRFLERLGETSVAYRDDLQGMAASIRRGYRPKLDLPIRPR